MQPELENLQQRILSLATEFRSDDLSLDERSAIEQSVYDGQIILQALSDLTVRNEQGSKQEADDYLIAFFEHIAKAFCTATDSYLTGRMHNG